MRIALGSLTALLIFAASGCANESGQAREFGSDTEISVVASFYPVAEMVERIGGSVVEVQNLTPPGTEPHDLELSPDQMAEIQDADLVFYVGNGFAPAIESAAKNRHQPSIDLSQDLTLDSASPDGHDHEHDHGTEEESTDPHFWLDPVLLSETSTVVENALVQRDPARSDSFRQNANTYRDELTKVDGEFRNGLASCGSNKMVTSHAAFHYMAKRYGLQQIPIAFTPEADVDPSRLDALVRKVRTNNVTTVFTEPLSSSRMADTLAREAGIKTAVLNPLEGLTREQLDAGATYASVMRENLAQLRPAMDCR